MGKILKRGRVVILLAGRRAGKKAIIMKPIEDGKKKRKFGHCLVVGVEKPPRQISKKMSKKKLTRKARVKPFVKYVNNTHLLATRFLVKDDGDFDFKSIVSEESLENPEARKTMIKSLKAKMEERFLNPTTGDKQDTADFLFKKLRF